MVLSIDESRELAECHSLEEGFAAAMDRIQSSTCKDAFETAGITEEDIRKILEEIREEKVDTVKYEGEKLGRNEPCPCRSDKKYKKCYGG